MAELRKCEFVLLRYMPDIVAGEAVNFGVVLLERGWPHEGQAFVRIAAERGWQRVQRFFPEANVAQLQAIGEDLRRDFETGTVTREGVLLRGEFLRTIEELFSNGIAVSARQGVETLSPAEEADTLMRMYLEHHGDRGERKTSGRAEIRERMRSEFRTWHVLGHPQFLQDLKLAEYAETRNPMKIDFAYPTQDRQLKMYHAVALGADANTAARLAQTYAKLRSGIEQRLQREALLTAVIAEDVDRSIGEAAYAIEVMEEVGMRVETVAAMPRIAQMAAEELGV
jgi:Protein of unknown function (DUF3037)